MRLPFCGVFCLALLASACVGQDRKFEPRPFDWPQWQGLKRDALSPEKGLLQQWPKEGPKLLWTAEGLGDTYSTPTVAAGRIFTMGNKDRKEFVFALSEEDGKPLWQFEVGAVRSGGGGYPGPRCSPTVDGERVYALGLNGDLVCLESAGGKEVWRKDLVKDFKGAGGGWGYSESPLIDGDRVLVTPGGKTATLVCLNKKTGEEVWKGVVPNGDGAGYSSIVVAEFGGEKQYVQFLSGGVVGLSADGKFLWRYDNPANTTANCSTPICHGDLVFAASNYGVGGGAARVTRDGDKWKAEEAWFSGKIRNHHGGVLLLDGYLYGSDDNALTCLDLKTGKVQWAERKAGKGSIAYADGRLYYRNEGGPMMLVEASPNGYVEHGRFKPKTSGAPAWPHPVVANGRLYVQDQENLYCYDVKKGQ